MKDPGSYMYRVSRDLAKLRIIRSAKIVLYFDSARIMVECIARAAKELLFICILILLFTYIYAVFGVTSFNYESIEPDVDQPLNFPKSFNTVLDALKCMWQIFTNDHWLAVLFDARQVTSYTQYAPPARRNSTHCWQICSDSSKLSLVSNSVHTADATQLDSCVASASAVRTGL